MSSNVPIFIFLASIPLSFFLSNVVANWLRMKEMGWRLGIIFLSLATAAIVLTFGKPSLGIDLRGGDILTYEVDEKTTKEALTSTSGNGSANARPGDPAAPLQIDMPMLLQSLGRRINPGGQREIVIREYGTNQVEIIIPEVSAAEIDTIKDAIRKTGFLKFRIVADEFRNPRIWELGEKQLQSDNELEKAAKYVYDGEKLVGEWIRVGREEVITPGVVPNYRIEPDYYKTMLHREIVPDQLEVLTIVDPVNNVEGKDLANVGRGFDEFGGPAVDFMMNTEGAIKMSGLTGSNLPDPNNPQSKAKLGIVLDDELLSCPVINSRISSSGTIEGHFSETEVDTLMRILRDGKMPAVLFPEPISESSVSPLLGEDTIRKGKLATGASLVVVVLFMLWYYRFAGLVACAALVANLFLTVAAMIVFKASFTLPGIAGLVLTVGMSVDANVLIYERIREELSRGASLRMAIRNGFDRAMSAIVDSNVTTLIVAVVLYAIGTADLRGFAVSLTFGILMSMFTAIFCSRVFLEIAERKKWIRGLTMVKWLGETNFPFMRMTGWAVLGSAVVILVGFVGVFARGANLFDIDFLGGTSVQVVLKKPLPIGEVRELLAGIADDVWVTGILPEGRARDTVYKIDTSLRDSQELRDQGKSALDELQNRVQNALVNAETGEPLWLARNLEFTPAAPFEAKPVPSIEPAAEGQSALPRPTSGELGSTADRPTKAPAPPARTDVTFDGPIRERLVSGRAAWQLPVQADGSAAPQETPPEDSAPEPASETPPPAEVTPAAEEPPAEPSPPAEEAAAPESAGTNTSESAAQPEASQATSSDPAATSPSPSAERPLQLQPTAFRSTSQLTFEEKISERTLERLIETAAKAVDLTPPVVRCRNDTWDGRSDTGFTEWTVDFTTDSEQTDKILSHLHTQIAQMPVWLSSNAIGGKIAGQMQTKAWLAIIFSLVAIIFYIWLRFEKVAYGLAAVIAVIHDVLVTLGAIALSPWIAQFAGFLMIEEFKISLPIIAAFLTLIGYSLNDTIVIFDRIREIKGKSPDVTEAIIDRSVNQTLSRTILTSLTVFMVVVVLYFFGGEGIHPFAYALFVGLIAGTYSTVFIASPMLLWFLRWSKAREESRAKPYSATVR